MTHSSISSRPQFPARAVVTAGMPYGNKELHFGHVSGVFVPADFYARFLRDRIGAHNVIFVSGTDCYGSPIMEGYRKRVANEGYAGTIEDYVQENHELQASTLDAYLVSCDLFGGSALGQAASIHAELTAQIVQRLHDKQRLSLMSTRQFFDVEAQQFLNGRQVQGRCPVQGCKSEKAYADECDLGHQFEPEELIAPVSQLTGTRPCLRAIQNWYFDLPRGRELIAELVVAQKNDERVRSVVSTTVEEWLLPPTIHIQHAVRDQFDAIAPQLPVHTIAEPEGKQSFEVIFETWQDRDVARDVLVEKGLRFRTGKTLLPFRISGNVEWGVPIPTIDDIDGLTAWCWPESLWAPISFTQTVLDADTNASTPRYKESDWHSWWCSPDAAQFQFIGQDNIYFYCVAQPALWDALDWNMTQAIPVANHHVLFMGKKASSSGAVKPPMAQELLDFYTPEQLRAHWLSLGLADKPVSFSPKALEPDPSKRDDPRIADPALKESALLTNVFNRLARSCFYGAREACELHLPSGNASPAAQALCEQALLAFEKHMYELNFPAAMRSAEELIREANKRWSDASKDARNAGDDAAYIDALRDAFLALRVATLLMHPAVPQGCEAIRSYFDLPAETFFSWDTAFDGLDELVKASGREPGAHLVKELPPRTDFFEKHPSQH